MDIAEVVKKKAQLEQTISVAIESFQQETGATVADVRCNYTPIAFMASDRTRQMLTGVEVTVQL